MSRSPLLICLLLALAAAAGGCATGRMSAEDCRAADWRAQGVEDGKAGWPAAYFTRYVEDCQAVDAPDLSAWSEGREEGLRTYCTPAGGYAAGREGREYAGVCPEPLDPVFLDANHHGLTYFRMRRRIADLERLERDYRFACPPGVGAIGVWDRCPLSGGYGGYYGSDLRLRAELREMREEIIYFSSWPPPGGEAMGRGF